MDYILALLTYAQSTLLSYFTLSTDGLSASLALFEGEPQSETMSTVLSAQLKWLYHEIFLLEVEVFCEDGDEILDKLRVMLKGKEKKDGNTERGQ